MKMNKQLGLMKSHISSLQQLLSKYIYVGDLPNTQASYVKGIRNSLADLEYSLNKAIGNDKSK